MYRKNTSVFISFILCGLIFCGCTRPSRGAFIQMQWYLKSLSSNYKEAERFLKYVDEATLVYDDPDEKSPLFHLMLAVKSQNNAYDSRREEFMRLLSSRSSAADRKLLAKMEKAQRLFHAWVRVSLLDRKKPLERYLKADIAPEDWINKAFPEQALESGEDGKAFKQYLSGLTEEFRLRYIWTEK